MFEFPMPAPGFSYFARAPTPNLTEDPTEDYALRQFVARGVWGPANARGVDAGMNSEASLVFAILIALGLSRKSMAVRDLTWLNINSFI